MRTFDAVFDSQRVFRRLLHATSRPGEVLTLPDTGGDAFEAVSLILLDVEVTFCTLGPAGEVARGLQERLSAATGARVALTTQSDFALVPDGGSEGTILDLRRGTFEAPEKGATAVYRVTRLGEPAERGSLALTVSGPGVPGSRVFGVKGLPFRELEAIQESRAGYPLGVDVYLVDGSGRLAGLPRSTRVEVGG